MQILLLKPKATYVLTRFMDACSRLGINLHILFAANPSSKNYVVSFTDDAYETLREIPVDGECVAELAPFLRDYDAVVAAGEYSVILSEHLSKALGLFHNPLAMADAYRNKVAMRACFGSEGVCQPRLLARFTCMEEVDAFDWSSVKFPVIVKPIDLSSSFYVRLCDNAQSARRVYRLIFKHTQSFSGATFTAHGLLEEAVFGPEYSVECVVQDGRIVSWFLTTKFVSPYPACDEIGHLSGEQFATATLESSALTAIRGIVRAWQVHSAVMHIEFKVCGDEVKIIEGACRIGGDMISTLVELRYGVSLEECLILLRCQRDVQLACARGPRVDDGYYYGICYLFAENLDARLPESVEVLQTVRLAKQAPPPGGGLGLEQRLGHKLVRSRSLEAIRQYIGTLSAGHAPATVR